MKKTSIFLFFLLTVSLSINAQQKALTSNGDEVILNADGTWNYTNEKRSQAGGGSIKVDTNKINFTKNAGSSFMVKSNKIACGVYINPQKWSFEKSKEGEASEFEFSLREKDAYGLLITEKIEVPMSALEAAALNNAREVSPDISIVKKEYRKVNGKPVLMMQMTGMITGIKFIYFGYYYSSKKGTTQLLTYTAANLLDEYHDDLEEFLNGFVAGE